MVELDRILSERSDERILSAVRSLSASGFSRFVERILGYLDLTISRSRIKEDFVIADCVHRPDSLKYVVFFSRRDENVAKQSVDSLVSYMGKVEAVKGLVLSSSPILPDAVKLAEMHDVGVADGPKLAALVRRFDLDRDLIREAELSSQRDAELAKTGHLDGSAAAAMADGFEALSNKDFLKALESVDQAILSDDTIDAAWRLKGVVLDEMGYHEQALECFRHALAINKGSDETWYALANCFYSLSRHEEELKCYDRALEINPLNLKALLNKGGTLHRLGRYQEALDTYDEVLRRNYRLEKVHNNRGVTLHKLGRHEESLEAYDRAIALRHDYVEAIMNKANLLFELGNDDEALSSYSHITEIRPDIPLAWRSKGLVALKMGKRSAATRAFEEALRLDVGDAEAKRALDELRKEPKEELIEAPGFLEEIFAPEAEAPPAEIVAEPTQPLPPEEAIASIEEESLEQIAEELYGDRAELLLLLGRLDEAYDYLIRSLRLEGENSRLLTAAGSVLFRQGKHEAAIKTYEHAYAADRSYSPALYNLHMALMVAGESELAAKVSQSLRESSRGWQGRAASAIEAMKRKDYRQAIEDTEVALAAENLSTLHNFKGVLQLVSDDVDGATETFTRLTADSFDRSEAHNNLGFAILKKGDWEGAGAEFDKAMRLRKGNPTAWNNRGCVLYKEDRLREAIACFEESLVINPTAVAMGNKGFTQLMIDMLDDAIRSFEQSLKILETPEAFNNKGIALLRSGRVDAAVVAFREALRLSPQFEDANANLRSALSAQSSRQREMMETPPPPPPPSKTMKSDSDRAKMQLLRHESEKTLKKKKKSELEAICIALDKSSRGTKKELVARILKEKRRLLRKSRR